MENKHIKIHYSQVDPDALSAALRANYDLAEPVNCCLFRKGMSDVYKVTSGGGVYYLKNYLAGTYDRADYEEEAHIINSLIENGINAAVPVPRNSVIRDADNDREFVWEIDAPEGVRYAILFTEAKEAPSEDGEKKSFALGRALAKIHAISDEYDYKISRPAIDFVQLIDQPMEKLRPHLEQRNSDEHAFISGAMEDLREFISQKLTMEKPYYGFCHGDVQYSNVCFNGDEPTLFDFDTMGYGFRAHDISVNIFNNESFINPQFRQSGEGKAFFDGYNSVRQLTENEFQCIDAFGAIRAIWALGINIDLLKVNGHFSAVSLIDYLCSVFRTWYNKVFPT